MQAAVGDKYGKRLIFTKKKMGAQTAEANDNAARQERDMGVAHNQGYPFGDPQNKDYSIKGSKRERERAVAILAQESKGPSAEAQRAAVNMPQRQEVAEDAQAAIRAAVLKVAAILREMRLTLRAQRTSLCGMFWSLSTTKILR